jgi:hypothetical protein
MNTNSRICALVLWSLVQFTEHILPVKFLLCCFLMISSDTRWGELQLCSCGKWRGQQLPVKYQHVFTSQYSTVHSSCHEMQKTTMVNVLKTARWILWEKWKFPYNLADTCCCCTFWRRDRKNTSFEWFSNCKRVWPMLTMPNAQDIYQHVRHENVDQIRELFIEQKNC